jgi:hypothetical protein
MLDFDNVTDDWSEGDTISGNIIKDGDWWNFELPSKQDRITELEQENKELKEELSALKGKGKIKNDPDEEIDLEEDLPF